MNNNVERARCIVEEFNKNYVLFYPVGSEHEDGSVDVMAASYIENEDGTCGELHDIETDEEWALVEEMLESFAGDDCDCEECECEEEDEHCCCCHHGEEE